MISGIKRTLTKYVNGCKTCQKQARRLFNPTLGTRETKTFVPNRPFQETSVDPIGEFLVKPFENSRTRCKLYPLVFYDIQIGFVHVELIPSLKSKHILIAILNLQTTYATKVEYLISDAGTSLQESALKSEIEDFKRGIVDIGSTDSGIKIKNNLTNAQFRNPVESSIKLLKRYTNMILDKTKSQTLPALEPSELKLVMNLACHCINRRPYPNQDGLLSPLHFVLTTPFYHLIQLGENSKDLSKSYGDLQNYLNHFKHLRKNMLISESKNFLKKRFRNSGGVDLYHASQGDLVFVDYPHKQNSYDFGIIKEVVGSDAIVKFRNESTEKVPVSLLYTLSQRKHSMGEEGEQDE